MVLSYFDNFISIVLGEGKAPWKLDCRTSYARLPPRIQMFIANRIKTGS